ncbi:hypothetical protein ACHMW7_16210 [Aminobacter sp. UC22_36]|uniref:hypothetical protein n=1 Tax=Aminobacter sp. UC22_36 TaxID=3374549 RepID=UPI0037578AE1
MKRIPITEATATQLADFATANLGLTDVQFRMGADKIRSLMATVGYDKDYIEIAEPPVGAGRAPIDPDAVPSTERRYVNIIIQAQEGPGGSDPVPVSVNGRAMWIERAKESRIPFEYFEALRNAVKKVYDPNPQGGLMPPRNVPTYPFTVLSLNA